MAEGIKFGNNKTPTNMNREDIAYILESLIGIDQVHLITPEGNTFKVFASSGINDFTTGRLGLLRINGTPYVLYCDRVDSIEYGGDDIHNRITNVKADYILEPMSNQWNVESNPEDFTNEALDKWETTTWVRVAFNVFDPKNIEI